MTERKKTVVLAGVLVVAALMLAGFALRPDAEEPNGFAEHIEAPADAGYGPGIIPVTRGAGDFRWKVGGAWRISSVRISPDPIWTSLDGITYTFSPWTSISADRALEVAMQLGTAVDTWTAQGCRWFYAHSALGFSFPSWLLVVAPEEGTGPGLTVMVQGTPGMDAALPAEVWAVFNSVTYVG